MKLVTLVLAAGAGRRFGEAPKQLAMYVGKPLLTYAISLAEQATPGNVYVVLGSQAHFIQSQVELPHTLIHEHWAQGMGSSLAYGISQLPQDTDAVLVLLADQIALSDADIFVLCDQFKKQVAMDVITPAIVCAQYREQLGVPAIFPKRYFPELEKLTGDKGAKHLLSAQTCIAIPLDRAAIDIDTQKDLQQINSARPKCNDTLSQKSVNTIT